MFDMIYFEVYGRQTRPGGMDGSWIDQVIVNAHRRIDPLLLIA